MKRGMIALALSASALSMAFSGGAMAAGTQGKSATGTSMSKQSAQLSKEMQANKLIDMRVNNNQGQELGKISNLLIDKNGKVSHVVLQESGTLGMGGKSYAIPWSRVKIAPDETVATVNVSKEKLSSEFAAFEPTKSEKSERNEQPSEQPSGSQGTQGGSSGGGY